MLFLDTSHYWRSQAWISCPGPMLYSPCHILLTLFPHNSPSWHMFSVVMFCYVLNAILRHILLLKILSPLAISCRLAQNSHSRLCCIPCATPRLHHFPHSSLPKTYRGVCFLLFYVLLDVLNAIIRHISLKISSPLMMCHRLMDVYVAHRYCDVIIR